MVRTAQLAWLLFVKPLAFLRIQNSGLGHLEIRLNFKCFLGRGFHFRSYFLDIGSNQRSMDKFDLKSV